jgi:trimethylamine--corrinoid protein Co-methyltransferase
MLDFLLVFSLPKLVFDDEMCGQALRFVREIRVTDDLPVKALVDKVMTDQHLIMADHTTAHWPTELHLPSPVVDRDNREGWLKAGGKDTAQRAADDVDRRLAAYRPIETDPATVREMERIIRSGLVSQSALPVLPAAGDRGAATLEAAPAEGPGRGRRVNARRLRR